MYYVVLRSMHVWRVYSTMFMTGRGHPSDPPRHARRLGRCHEAEQDTRQDDDRQRQCGKRLEKRGPERGDLGSLAAGVPVPMCHDRIDDHQNPSQHQPRHAGTRSGQQPDSDALTRSGRPDVGRP